jgi:hypothetical protein
MKPLSEYLKPVLTPEQTREQGAYELRAMIARMRKKKEAA